MAPTAPDFADPPDLDLLARQGWQVMRTSSADDSSDTRRRLLAWIRGFGTPTETTHGVLVWPVSARSDGPEATFSETNASAPLHTDSQFRAEPEDAFALLCIRPAPVGGASLVAPADEVVGRMRAAHPDALALLRSVPVPFLAPRAFTDDGLSWHRVVDSAGVTWRWDTLEAGLEKLGDVPQDVRAALEAFHGVVESVAPTQIELDSGDLLLVDNRRCLHGRTAFSGERLLYRVRFNWC